MERRDGRGDYSPERRRYEEQPRGISERYEYGRPRGDHYDSRRERERERERRSRDSEAE